MVNNRPLLRFNGFQEPWEIKKLGEVFDITRGYVLATNNVSSSANFNNIYPVYSSQTLNSGLLGYYKEYLYENAITWTTDGANAGTVNFRKGKFYCTNVCGVLLPKIEIPNKMIALAINLIAKRYVSYVGNPKLMNTTMAEITLPLPLFPEQAKIGNLFNNIDTLIENEENKYNKLLDIKKSLLNKMFPLENTYIPSIRFNGYSEKWEVKKLGDYLYDPLLVQLNVTKSEQIITLGLNLSGIRSGSTKNGTYFGATKYFVRHSGQLLYGKQNFFNGSMAIIGDEFEGKGTSGDVPSFDIKYIDKHFLYYYIARPEYYEDKERESIGTGSKRIHQSTLKEFSILNPKNINEQYKIGQLFIKLEYLINFYASKTNKLKTIKQSILKLMFV